MQPLGTKKGRELGFLERPKDMQPIGTKEGRELVPLVVGFIIRFIISYNK
jgi:ribosomal protein L34